jgi:large subunit ribosomal protein L18e
MILKGRIRLKNMVKRGATNPRLLDLINELNKQKKGIWKKTAKFLSRPTRQRPWINLSKIDRYSKKDEVILVPGKVLASGDLSKSVTVAAWRFSESAKEKISKAKGKAISISKLMKDNPTGKSVRMMIA